MEISLIVERYLKLSEAEGFSEGKKKKESEQIVIKPDSRKWSDCLLQKIKGKGEKTKLRKREMLGLLSKPIPMSI